MKLQILIPQYKETEQVIKPLLDSINNQLDVDFKEIGVIICNDGSDVLLTDSFLNQFKFDVKYIKAEHGGVSKTRNTLLDYATADYIMYCDADDKFHDMLGLFYIFDKIEEEPFDVLVSKFISEQMENDEMLLSYVNNDDSTFVHGKVLRRNYLLAKDIRWCEELTVHEDCYFNVLAQTLTENVVHYPNSFYMWCHNPSSVTRQSEDFKIKTYDKYIKSVGKLIDELIRRDCYDCAVTNVANLTFQVFYSINCKDWFDNEYRPVVENEFKNFFHKYKDLWKKASDELKFRLSLNVMKVAYNDGFRTQKITLKDWLQSIGE